MTARPIRRNAQTPDRNGKIFYTSTTSLSHISKCSLIVERCFAVLDFPDNCAAVITWCSERSGAFVNKRNSSLQCDFIAVINVQMPFLGIKMIFFNWLRTGCKEKCADCTIFEFYDIRTMSYRILDRHNRLYGTSGGKHDREGMAAIVQPVSPESLLHHFRPVLRHFHRVDCKHAFQISVFFGLDYLAGFGYSGHKGFFVADQGNLVLSGFDHLQNLFAIHGGRFFYPYV